MANSDRPSGFTPVKWNGQANVYSIAASYATALGIGDPVKSSGTADANGVPGVVVGAATGALRGVIVGLGKSEGGIFNPSNLDQTTRPAADPAAWYALVVDDPDAVFEIQEHENGTALAAAQVGLNQISVAGTPTAYGSIWEVASTTDATAATTETLQLRLLGLSRKPNNAFGANAKWLVQINVHELGHGLGAAGV